MVRTWSIMSSIKVPLEQTAFCDCSRATSGTPVLGLFRCDDLRHLRTPPFTEILLTYTLFIVCLRQTWTNFKLFLIFLTSSSVKESSRTPQIPPYPALRHSIYYFALDERVKSLVMIEQARRRVIKTLNSRYVFGRVVRSFHEHSSSASVTPSSGGASSATPWMSWLSGTLPSPYYIQLYSYLRWPSLRG